MTLEIKNEISPTFEEVKKEVGKDAHLTVVKEVKGSFGRQVFIAEVVVYDSKKVKDKVETIPKKIKNKMAEEAKAERETAKKAKAAEKATQEAAEAAANVEETFEEVKSE